VRIHEAALINNKSTTAKDKRAVLFEVTSHLHEQHFLARRRFSDFDELDCLIRSAFRGTVHTTTVSSCFTVQ
jgi:hypothetical protein